jgi:hypothetical protein
LHNKPPAHRGGRGFSETCNLWHFGRSHTCERRAKLVHTELFGTHQITQGLYFYKLITDEFTETRKDGADKVRDWAPTLSRNPATAGWY